MEKIMAEQPILLNESIPAIGDIKINATYSHMFFDKEHSIADGTHIHSCFEIYGNLEGDVSFFHDREIYDIEPGDIVLSYPSDVHYCIYRSTCLHRHFCVWFSDDAIGDFLLRRGIRGKICPKAENRERIVRLLQSLCSNQIDPFIRASHLMELITLLDCDDQTPHTTPATGKMSNILAYIDTHLVEITGIKDVAKACFVAESTLYRMFRAELGISFHKYLEAQRLALAERHLRSDCSVTDACFLSGFTDCSRFITKFKDKFGITPLKYKKASQKT